MDCGNSDSSAFVGFAWKFLQRYLSQLPHTGNEGISQHIEFLQATHCFGMVPRLPIVDQPLCQGVYSVMCLHNRRKIRVLVVAGMPAGSYP